MRRFYPPGRRISEVEPVDGYKNGAFFSSFIEGYGTMDAIAGLAFGIVVIDVIRRMGVNDDQPLPAMFWVRACLQAP